jgi:UDP-N-acetylglucosamine diphosphorylase/glucosamine-1-phosphate N-acetyltransferase
MHLVVFEGSRWPSFAPLSLSRPVFTLQSGLSTLLEKQIRYIQPTRLTLWVRPAMVEYCKEHIVPKVSIPVAINVPLDDEPALLSSGRAVHFSDYATPTDPCVAVEEGDLIRQAYTKSPGLSHEDCFNRTDAWRRLGDLPKLSDQSRLAEYVWDLVHWNEEAIVADAVHLSDRPRAPVNNHYHVIAEQDVIVSPEAKIGPGVVLDAGQGPIVLDAGASIGANSVLRGPCSIGRYSSVAPLSFIHGGTSIGPMCKVGGEIVTSIFLGYSNKVHEGFVGHSYIGEWVNLGAGTTTSNLKNTYGPIKMAIGKREIVTDRRFLGTMIGDHSKTAIGTRLMSGSYIGYCSLLAAGGLPPRFIPSFAFWTDQGMQEYRLDKARQVMRQVYSRRGKNWDDLDEATLKYVMEVKDQVEQ